MLIRQTNLRNGDDLMLSEFWDSTGKSFYVRIIPINGNPTNVLDTTNEQKALDHFVKLEKELS